MHLPGGEAKQALKPRRFEANGGFPKKRRGYKKAWDFQGCDDVLGENSSQVEDGS